MLDTFPCVRRESGELVRREKAICADCSKLPEHLRAARIVEGLREFIVALATDAVDWAGVAVCEGHMLHHVYYTPTCLKGQEL